MKMAGIKVPRIGEKPADRAPVETLLDIYDKKRSSLTSGLITYQSEPGFMCYGPVQGWNAYDM